MSLWTMGFNQHVRGVWANHLVYNIHLLTGKIAEPGNSPFSLTGQPSACGTAREVGTFAHRLPADMVVTNPEHRKHAEEIWKLPAGSAQRRDRLPRRAAGSHAQGRQAQCLLDHVQQQPPDGAQHHAGDLPGLSQPRQLHRLLRPLSHGHRHGGRRGAADGDVGGEGRRVTAMPSAAPTCGASSSTRRARRGPTCGSSWSSPSASPPTRSGRPRRSPRNPNTRASRSSTCCGGTANVDRFPLAETRRRLRQPRVEGTSASTSRRVCSRNTPSFGRGHGHDLAPVRPLPRSARPALAGRQRQGDALALSRGVSIPMSRRAAAGSSTEMPDKRAIVMAAPYEPPAEFARPGVRPLARHRPRAGALALRLHDHARARALPGLQRRRDVHASR